MLWIMSGVLLLGGSGVLTSCSKDDGPEKPKEPIKPEKAIVILYDNDVHCAVEGYTRIAGLRDAIVKSDTALVAIVSCGDYLQGGEVGSKSQGQYIVDIMRNVGYDAVTLGSQEFDYGVPRLMELLPNLNASILCANLFKAGSKAHCYGPYVVRNYGKRWVAFVGVTTPNAMETENEAFFDAEDKQLYDLRSPEEICQLVQKAVDEARDKGAEYVVALTHLGELPSASTLTSQELIANTRGIDVVLDGFTHSVIESKEVPNIDGKMVLVSQTGTQFANVGKLVINADGKISTSLIPTQTIAYENQTVRQTIDSVYTEMNK